MPSPTKIEMVLKLHGMQSQLHKRLDHALMVHGISFTEFMVMYHLNNSASSNMRRIDLADSVGLSASGVTRLLNPMQKIGLVDKEESARDARVSLVKLTRSGKNIFKDAQQSINQCAESFLEPLDAKQLIELAKIVEDLL